MYTSDNIEINDSNTSFKEEDFTKEKLAEMLRYEQSKNDFLSSIIEKMPVRIYWLSRNNVYLGCNDLQVESLGLKSKEEIIGKTNSQLMSSAEAAELDRINENVMKSGVIYEGEEVVSSKNYLSKKFPLFDRQKKVEGLLGISIDITDQKRAEELELQNKLQKIKLYDQEEFRQFISHLAHDIVSPLISLEKVMNSCNDLPENQHVMLRDAVTNIRNISEALLSRYKKDQRENYSKEKQYILVALALEESIRQKKYEYKNGNADIRYSYDPSLSFTFIMGDQFNFGRMISNLINNSIEAFEGKGGTVRITFGVEDRLAKIEIEDNGKGMPKEMVRNILKNASVGTTKTTGYGIGLGQVRNTLKLYDGGISIESKEGVGTTITLTFPTCEAPGWIADRITLRKGDTVIILDDDEAVHSIWKERLKIYSRDLDLKFFTKGEDAHNFLDSAPFYEKDKLFLLLDYDLKGTKSGLHIILETGMKNQSVIVTSIHNDKMVQDLIQRSGVKMIPKQFLGYISIIMK